jgi:hypothetical protein
MANTALMLVVFALAGLAVAQTSAGKVADNPDAHPQVTRTDLKIIQRAREILKSPKQWNRADTRKCPSDAKTFSLYCALEEATKELTGSFQHRGAAMQEARFVIDAIAPNRKSYHHRLMDYNNDPSTTFADIQKLFRLEEEHIASELNETPSR